MQSLITKIHKLVTALYKLYIRRLPIVLLYAPGRVGTMGLYKKLLPYPLLTFKIESTAIDKRGTARLAHHLVLNRNRPAKIITLVRDPVEMMIGYFYSKAYWGHLPGAREALEQGDVAALQQCFITQVLQTPRLDYHLYWFEQEYRPQTGIDVFTYPFDPTEKSIVISDKTYPTLIMRTDLSDEEKGQQINTFLNISGLHVDKQNVRETKPLSDTYATFKETLQLPPPLLDKIYTSAYCTHFFSSDEIKEKSAQWSA